MKLNLALLKDLDAKANATTATPAEARELDNNSCRGG